jgi:hypothetical protein
MKKRPIPEYEALNPIDAFFSTKKKQLHNQGFYSYLKELYPRIISRQKLTNWQTTSRKESVEPELLLFIAIVCGSYFRIKDPEIILKETLTYLHEWFVLESDQHRMDSEIAKLVINALAPGIRSQIEDAGHKRGWPDGAHFRKKGPPIDMRGVWVTAVVIENYLKLKNDNPKLAKKKTLDFISILSGHKEEESLLTEFNRFYKNAPKDVIAVLTDALTAEYKFLMKQDGVEARDLAPSEIHKKEYAMWKDRHKSLEYEVKVYGWEGICNRAINRIPGKIWQSLWDIKSKSNNSIKE